MMAPAGGFAAALLVGGALTEYGPWPTRLCFWVLAVLLAALTIAMWFLPRRMSGVVKGGWKRREDSVFPNRAQYWLDCLGSGNGSACPGGRPTRSADIFRCNGDRRS